DIVASYFRRHRFAGVKDRGAISGHIYAVLRHRAALDWWIGRAGSQLATDGRRRTFAALVLAEGWDGRAVGRACDGAGLRPEPLDAAEQHFLRALEGQRLEAPAMPPSVRGNFPDWLLPDLQRAFGERLIEEMTALNGEAPLDLRANRLKGDRDAAHLALKREDVKAAPTPCSPLPLP